ncbi:MAG: CDP-alcohol phosphatidyltransferase family protein [Phycisphaera sp.]|nr:MAG: CDP-alcohol phosphatidyltransferase family protein [Phycisphaera sp.]
MAERVRVVDAGPRRPVPARGSRFTVWLASVLCRRGVTPNAVSVSSAVFAVFGGVALVLHHGAGPVVGVALLAAAVVCIGLRSLANLIDGMIAVEGGKATSSGAIYNEFPDRLSDIAFFLGAGYATAGTTGSVELGWTAALLAVLAAYTRALGAASGAPHDFGGPMAKPHRMVLLALGCVALAVEQLTTSTRYSLVVALAAVCLGSAVTIAGRLSRAVRALEVQP